MCEICSYRQQERQRICLNLFKATVKTQEKCVKFVQTRVMYESCSKIQKTRTLEQCDISSKLPIKTLNQYVKLSQFAKFA